MTDEICSKQSMKVLHDSFNVSPAGEKIKQFEVKHGPVKTYTAAEVKQFNIDRGLIEK